MGGEPVAETIQPTHAFDFPGTSRFEILSVLGQGGVGVVYEAYDRERNERVALKTLRVSSGESLRLLKNEFRSVQDLSHPNLVELGELFEDRGRWFFTMELVRGEDFVRRVRPGGDLDPARLRAALVQLARGLGALHASEKVHRDVKPSNVLVTDQGRVVVLDFGVLRDLDAHRSAAEQDAIIGTAAYMAPEQIASEHVGPAADLYAVGSMLYEALTGRPPFSGSLTEILTAKLERVPPPPSTTAAGVPEDLERLCLELLTIEPKARPTITDVLRRLDATVDGELGAAAQVPFTGRKAELQALSSAFESSLEHAVAVVVSGESGAGKTRLARTFADAALARDGRTLVLRGRCFERESAPFKGVDGMIDELSEHLGALPEALAAALLPAHPNLLTRVFPVLAQVPAFAGARPSVLDELVPDEMRRRVFVGIRQLLASVAETRRVVLLLDDLQWTNADALALLRTLLMPPDAPRLLLVATLRTSDGAVAPELPGDVRRVPVGALAPDDARFLARRLLGAAAPAESVDALVSESKGHPLFLDELAREGSGTTRAAPVVRLDDALWARVCRLPPEARSVIELLALSGLPVSPSVVASAASMTRGQVARVVWMLRTARLARLEGGAANAPIAPYHDRVRESVLAHLDAAERREKHERLALALEGAADANPEELATHWQEAGLPDRAAEYALKAAATAERALAFEQAAHLYRRALDARAFPPAEAISIQRRCAEALNNAGRLADSARLQLAIADRESTLPALDLRRRAAEQLLVGGHFDEGNRIMKDVVTQVGLRFPQSALLALVLFLWHRLLLRLRGLRFTERVSSSVDAHAMTRLDVTWSAGQGFLMTDNIRGVYFLMLSLRGALAAGEPLRLMRATAFEALAAGAPSRAWTRRLLAITRDLGERLMTPYAQAVLAFTEGGTGYFWGEWKRGGEALARAERILRERCIGVSFELNTARLYLLRVLSYLGDLRQMMEYLPPLVREAEQREDRYAIINLRAVGCYFVALAANDPAEALRQLELAEAGLGRGRYTIQHYICLYARCQIDLYAGRPSDALSRLDASWNSIGRSMLLRVEIIRIQLVEIAARAAIAAPATREERARNLTRAERWAAALDGELPAWAHALAALVRGCFAAARSDREAAHPALERAIELLRAADMPLHAAAAERRLGLVAGGAEGAARIAEADACLQRYGVAAPDRWTDLLAPVGSTRSG